MGQWGYTRQAPVVVENERSPCVCNEVVCLKAHYIQFKTLRSRLPIVLTPTMINGTMYVWNMQNSCVCLPMTWPYEIKIELSNLKVSMATVIAKRFYSEMRNMPNVREGFQMTLTQTIHLVLHRSFLCCWYLASNFQSRIVNTPCFASIDTTLNHKNKLFILYTNLSLLQEKTIST